MGRNINHTCKTWKAVGIKPGY